MMLNSGFSTCQFGHSVSRMDKPQPTNIPSLGPAELGRLSRQDQTFGALLARECHGSRKGAKVLGLTVRNFTNLLNRVHQPFRAGDMHADLEIAD